MTAIPLKRFRALIRTVAHRHAVQGNFRLAEDDLVSEGYLTLLHVSKSIPPTCTYFPKYLKRALMNRVRDLAHYHRREMRHGLEVPLTESMTPERSKDPHDYFAQKLDHLKPLLSPLAFRFVSELIDPSDEVQEEAFQDFCRKLKVHSQGRAVYGFNTFRVRLRHIREVLGITRNDERRLLLQVKSAVKRSMNNGQEASSE
jgi:hypothetical protein